MSAELERGRDAFARRAWAEALDGLERAERAEDLELLAVARYMRGDDDGYLQTLPRVVAAHVAAGARLPAARAAGWLGMMQARRGEIGAATAWLGRAQRLVEEDGGDCAERAYLTLPEMFRLEAQGRFEEAAAIAAAAAAEGRRLGDPDLEALATHAHGHMLVLAGRIEDGVALLDEAMLDVTTRELSPIVSGIVYCGVIIGCHAAFDVRRAQEWTTALTRWCDDQPEMLAFNGICKVHRAQLLQLRGEWPDALAQAQRVLADPWAGAQARYVEGQLHRLRGDYALAEAAYRDAARGGCEPQPGLALLRLAQGDAAAAAAALERALCETSDRTRRAELLAAQVEVLLAQGDVEGARAVCEELERLAAIYGSDLLTAGVDQARGAVDLAAGDAAVALPALRRAWRGWQEVGAPYEGARTRELVGLACRALGDDDAAAMELDAAREAFATLGAGPDVARVQRLEGGPRRTTQGLSPRELQVLRLVAGGATNRAIAAELVLSEKTVDRHVSNILAKLRVPSRAAATAFAYEHDLL